MSASLHVWGQFYYLRALFNSSKDFSNGGGLGLKLLWDSPMEEETLKIGINSTGESHVQNMGKTGGCGAFTAMLSKLVAHFMTLH